MPMGPGISDYKLVGEYVNGRQFTYYSRDYRNEDSKNKTKGLGLYRLEKYAMGNHRFNIKKASIIDLITNKKYTEYENGFRIK